MAELDAQQLDAINDISPTDARILDELSKGRNVPVNLANDIDRNTTHVRNRLAELRTADLVRRVGSESVSLHELTEKGDRVRVAYDNFRAALDG